MVIAAMMAAAAAAVSPHEAVGVRDILEAADIASPVISPDGRLVAFRVDRPSIDRNRHELAWYIVPVDASTPARRVADGGSGLFSSAGTLISERPIWSSDSRSIYFRALIDGSVQIWKAATDRSAATPVTADPADIRSFALAADGQSLSYRTGPTREAVAGAEARAYDDGVLVDATVDMAVGVSGGGIINGRPASQRLAGHWFERRGLLGDQPDRIGIVAIGNPDSDRTTPASGEQKKGPTTGPAAMSSDRFADRSDMAKRDLCTVVACDRQTVIRLQPIPGGTDILMTMQSLAYAQSLYRWRGSRASVKPVLRTAGLVNGGRDLASSCGLTASFAFCVVASAMAPPRLVRVSLKRGTTETVFDPNAALRPRLAARARQLNWQDAEGHAFTGQLVLPVGVDIKAPSPLVIDYYRCPGFLRGGVGDETPLLPLAGLGIATLCINATYASAAQDSRKDYSVALGGIRAIVARLDRDGVIDRSRVGMAGLSFGSEVVMWVARHSSLLAAASIASGQLEPGYYWYNAVRGRDVPDALKAAWGLGDPDRDRSGWLAVAPALDTDAIRVPLLMQLPELEARWSMELYAKLSRSTTPVELYAFADAAHVKSQPRQKLAAYQRNLDWFAFWLAGRQDPSPAKADQYARWRALAARRSADVRTNDRPGP